MYVDLVFFYIWDTFVTDYPSTFENETLYSITGSIGDYHACAKMARVPPPSIHAINRGIMVEGCLSMISGFFGAGHATSTYGGHIGSIGITKVSVRYDCLH